MENQIFKQMGLRYPIGDQDFAGIREEGKVYVDKTDIIYELVKGSKYIFLSRPRRFGKSLLLSTIEAYFQGRKELFEGLAIESLEKEWSKYPVLHLELSRFSTASPGSLPTLLNQQFGKWENEYGITHVPDDFGTRFAEIIEKAFQKNGKGVVVLVDEYDHPLINTLHDESLYERNREILRSVYVNLKALDRYIRFGMLTGVSRFSKTNIFSALNNLEDITFLPQYSCICGFTEEEIRRDLWEGVKNIAQSEECSDEEALRLLKKEYDGYHFSRNLIDIYNPFSLLNSLKTGFIENYWHRSGLPDFLEKKMKDSNVAFSKLFDTEASEYKLAESDTSFSSPVALLYQTGYLTIKSYNKEDKEYVLGIPNREVEQGLFLFLMGSYMEQDPDDGNRTMREMAKCLKRGETEEFLERLQSFIASIGYPVTQNKSELFFEQGLYIILRVLGLHVHTEMATSNGRIDLLVETDRYVYVIELKLDKTPEEALAQIKEKHYSLPWKHDGRKVFEIGISFSSEERNIMGWKVDTLS